MKRGIVLPHCGSQYVGMGKELYDTHRLVQEYFEEAIECTTINFIKLCFASSDVDITAFSQGPLALLLVECATAALLRDNNITYDATIGWDVASWYAAVHAAKAITLPDALYMVRKWIDAGEGLRTSSVYGTLKIDGKRPSTDAMIATLSTQAAERGFFLRIMTVSLSDIFVGGDNEGLMYLQDILQREDIAYEYYDGIDCRGLALPDEYVSQVQQYLEKVDFSMPHCPVINPLTGDWIDTADELRSCARDIVVRPIRQDRIIRTAQSLAEFICVVPAGRLLSELKAIFPHAVWWSMDSEADYQHIRQNLALEENLEEEQS